MAIRDVLRYCNDTDTIALRLFGGIGCTRLELHEFAKIQSQFFTRITDIGKILHESVKNMPKASTIHVRIKGNLRLFVTIREIFSLKEGIKAIYPCLGITSKINVHRRAAVVFAPHLECQNPTVDSTKKTASKN